MVIALLVLAGLVVWAVGAAIARLFDDGHRRTPKWHRRGCQFVRDVVTDR